MTDRQADSLCSEQPEIPERAIDKVAASAKEFGFRVPIVVDKDGIICGHTRLLAARKLPLLVCQEEERTLIRQARRNTTICDAASPKMIMGAPTSRSSIIRRRSQSN